MKSRPILFSAPMVRALLDGTKTQTRQVVRKQFAHDATPAEVAATSPEGWQISGHSGLWWDDAGACIDDAVRCPYGQPGDQLWVRESWAEVARHEPLTDEDLPMRSDNRILVYAADPDWKGARQFLCADGVARWAKPARWTPSIHMPRWASRITLEITGVRVERLQNISETDALAEGVESIRGEREWFRSYLPSAMGTNVQDFTALTAIDSYRTLWQSINGLESWETNLWVWVVEFKRIAGGAA